MWLPVKGYEERYEVSNLGRVRSIDRTQRCSNGNIQSWKGKMIKPYIKSEDKRYLKVTLCKNGKQKNVFVHRLVAEAFIPNPNNLPQVNHKDEDKSNNRVENLEWCTPEYNLTYGTARKRIAKSLTNGKCSKPILQIDPLTMETVKEWPSAMECERNGYDSKKISSCCHKKQKTHKGFIWKFKRGRHKKIKKS